MRWRSSIAALLCCCACAAAQSPVPAPDLPMPATKIAPAEAPKISIPRLVRYTAVARDVDGKPRTTTTGVTFAIYEQQQGGAPLWQETQNVQPDAQGRYSVLLGTNSLDGIPAEIFAGGKGQWLGVQVESQPEQPRVMLVSVPYALRAEEAERIGGRTASELIADSAQVKQQVATEVTAELEKRKDELKKSRMEDSAKGRRGVAPMDVAGKPPIFSAQSAGGTIFRIEQTGEVWAAGGFNSGGADFAESVESASPKAAYEPGDVLVIDPAKSRSVDLAATPYSTRVAGIYSTKPGILALPHGPDDSRSAAELPLAVVGIVPCKVSTENGAIAIGDLLVTSATPGYAMKGTDRSKMLGAVVGKALEALPSGKGTIQVLVTLQ